MSLDKIIADCRKNGLHKEALTIAKIASQSERVTSAPRGKKKPSIGTHEKFHYAVNIDALDDNAYYTQPYGRQFDDHKKIADFKESATKKYIRAKRKATLPAVKKWIREYKPSEYYARWEKDDVMYSGDVVDIWVK